MVQSDHLQACVVTQHVVNIFTLADAMGRVKVGRLVPPLAGYFYQTMPLIGWKCVTIHAWLLYRGRLLSSSGPWVERNRQRLVSTNQYSDGGRTFSCCCHRRTAVASWQQEFLPEGLWRDTSRRDHRGPIYGEDNVAGTYVKKGKKIWIETFWYLKIENSTTIAPR